MADHIPALTLHFEWAENKLRRAADLSKEVAADATKHQLFFATCRDLSKLQTGFEKDHLAFAIAHKDQPRFDSGEHATRLNNFDDLYYEATATWTTITEASKGPTNSISSSCTARASPRLPIINLPHSSGNPPECTNFANLFVALVAYNRSLTNIE